MNKKILFVFLLAFFSVNPALADEDAPKQVPFLVFDLAGGAALPGNFLVGKKSPFDLLHSYDLLGWDPHRPDAVDTRFGLPMANRMISKILQGLLANLSSGAEKNLRMASILNYSLDDTGTNKLSAASLVYLAGNKGSVHGPGVGLYPTLSGGYSAAPAQSEHYKPLHIKDVTALTALGEEILDPRADVNAKAVYGINESMKAFDRRVLVAAIALNNIKATTGPSTIVINGCDYHDGTQTTGDNKDLEIGTEIGRAVELAHRNRRPLMFQIITDGGVGAFPLTRKWRSDDGHRSMTVIGYYSPSSPIPYETARIQLGAYTDSQRIDPSTIVGADPSLAAFATFSNYLNATNQLRKFRDIAPGIFIDGELNQSLLFAKDPSLED